MTPKRIDRDAFFSGYRKRFGRLSQSQVDGLNDLLGFVERDENFTDPRQIAYMLATVKHECADTWKPVVERGPIDYFDKYEPGTKIGDRLGNTEPGDGYRYRGRANYRRAGRRIGMNTLLLEDPDLVLKPGIAYQVMSVGMRWGIFTGKCIGDYIDGERCDYKNARRVINGLDRWDVIARYAEAFEAILSEALAERDGGKAA